MPSIPYGDRVHSDADLIHHALATRFLYAKRAELRKTLNLNSSRLYRALLHLERQGILLAEYRGMLALADRLWSCENVAI